MILIIHGTNRAFSQSKPVSDFVFNYLLSKQIGKVKLLDLTEISMSAYESVNMYSKSGIHSQIEVIQNSFLIPAEKMIFVTPEYNGSIPGILKLFIDACSIRDAKPSFYHKKALLVGVASGRAGNLRGLDHLAGVLMYMHTIIYPEKLPISRIESLLDDQTHLNDANTQQVLTRLLDEFLAF